MRRASTTPQLAIAVCLSLGALVPATPAAAASIRASADLGSAWSALEVGLGWVWGWLGQAPVSPVENERLQDGACSDPHGGQLPPGTICPTPPPYIWVDPTKPADKM